MFTDTASIEDVQPPPLIFDQNVENVFSPSYCSSTSYNLQALHPDGCGESFMTYYGTNDILPLTSDLEIPNELPDSASYEPPGTDSGLFKLAEESSDTLWPSDTLRCDMRNFFDPGVGRMNRASSIALSEKILSDAEWNIWAANLRHYGTRESKRTPTSYTCRMCQESFSRILELEKHAKVAKHKPFACRQCKACFSRQDALTRHREIHDSQKLYPCLLCDSYQGVGAFRRRDHLRQHLQKKHRLHPNAEFPRHCSYECCSFSERFVVSDRFQGFSSRREYSKHMREVHGKETHDCDIDGCNRVGVKGFARINDLHKHRKVVHGRLR
jgi:hypothetical protein